MKNFSPFIQDKEDIYKFLTEFYKCSDTKPALPDPYLDFFTSDATVIMGPNKVDGSSEITEMRKKMWLSVTKRHHVFNDVAPLSETELLVTGTVEYDLINGKTLTTPWAGKIVFEAGEKRLMKFYQVYLDTYAMVKALA